MTGRLTVWLGLLSVLLLPACATAARASTAEGEPAGWVRQGAALVVGDDYGRLHLFVGGEPFLADMDIGCGYQGYTRARQFGEKHTERGPGTIAFRGRLPGGDVWFEQRVAAVGDRVKVELTRTGEWPQEAGWCAFQFRLPFAPYAGGRYRADGRTGTFPSGAPRNFDLASGVRKLECSLDDPKLDLVLESTAGLSVQDMRTWNDRGYQISVAFPPTNPARVELLLTLPGRADSPPGPRVAISQIGYPASGLKFAVLEWPKGTPRPDDRVRLEDARGKVVQEGRFGATSTYDYIQSDCAEFDFTSVKEPGDYRLVWSGGARPIRIRRRVFTDALWQPTLDTFIPWEMCHARLDFGRQLPTQPACHLDDGTRVPAHFPGVDGFQSYDCEGTPYQAGDPIPVSKGGWHDAGDYDLNVHAQGYTTWMLALTYEEFGVTRDVATLDAGKQTFRAGRPDGLPDLLQQVEWGADWLLSMQQPDGRVYEGVIDQPARNTASVAPDKVTDGRPGTGDERQVYVDYHPDMQLVEVISLAAASRALAKARPGLSRRCLAAAQRAFAYFQTHPEVYRDGSYFNHDTRDTGRDGMVAAAAIELYLTTNDARYLTVVEGLSASFAKLTLEWPSTYATGQMSFWYAPPFLARLYPRLPAGALKDAVVETCRRAAQIQVKLSAPRPWSFYEWHFGEWGNNGHLLGRVFDAYWLKRVAPGVFTDADALRSAYWLFGLHPINDTVLVSGLGYPGPRFLYNGRVHAYSDGRAATIAGAVVPGMGSLPGTSMLVYRDQYGNYGANEACIYTQASYLFAVNALQQAGY